MKRALLLLLAVLSAGCGKLEKTKAELTAARLDEQRLNAQVSALERRVATLKTAADGADARASKANADLRNAQVTAVGHWKGDPTMLAEQKKHVALPASLATALDTAQSVAGTQADEQRFARAVSEKNGTEAAKVLDFWEEYFLEGVRPKEPEPAKKKVCPANRSLPCKRIDEDSLWCPDVANHTAWALLLDNGALSVGELSNGERHVIDSRLAPRVWLTRFGTGDDEALFVHELRPSTDGSLSFRTQWQSKLVRSDGRLESSRANLDGDPFTEALFWTKDELVLLDPTQPANVTVERGLSACNVLEQLDAPAPGPVKALCDGWRNPKPAADAGP